MTKLLLYMVAIAFLVPALARAQAPEKLNLVIALDLSRSVAVAGPDGKTEFQKNVDGVTRILAQVPAGARITVIGITDHSFTEPYILLQARVPDDPGYFGERLRAARVQIVSAWKSRIPQLNPHFPGTDILGALLLASQLFGEQESTMRRALVIFSDMRQETAACTLESPQISAASRLGPRCNPTADLRAVQIYALGVDGSGKSIAYWQSLQTFWSARFNQAGADLRNYSSLPEPPSDATFNRDNVK